ncbi:MAG: 2-dehydropantoate 2-reductase [Miltoncostaeaceae bacterium]|jgi:2-dehydropantoate 2-reductase|nr:2-dehydropantoate 2-reductase [Miltoncostaeaceae bacterium]
MVVGAGAVGSYYGALLARDGHEVTLVARGPHLDALRERGSVEVEEADGSVWRAPVRALASPADAGAPPDLAILTVKSHHTLPAARALTPALAPETLVLSLQNGVDNPERAAPALGEGRVLAGIAFVGLWVSAPGRVHHQAEGWVKVGDPLGGITERSRALAAVLGSSWEVVLSEDIVRDQWHKLLWNIGFNALCAITGATAGEALATPETRLLVREAMEEAAAVALARGVRLTREDIDEMAADNPQLRDYRPSTARDLDAGKRLEREALTGFVMRQGALAGVPTPVNRVLDALLALQSDRRAAAA